MKPHEVYPLPGNTPEGVDLPRHVLPGAGARAFTGSNLYMTCYMYSCILYYFMFFVYIYIHIKYEYD